MAEDVTFTQYVIKCSTCGEILTRTAYIDDDKPTVCPNDPAHSITIKNAIEYKGFYKMPEKGDTFLDQFLRQHKNRLGESDFAPIIIKPPAGKILELTKVCTIWHEKLIMNSSVVWEVQMFNPMFDPNSPESSTNPLRIAVSQFFYRDFADLWGGAYARPVSDGPTREMQHIFTNRNSNDNTNPFILKSSLGMRIYAYSTDESKHADGEGFSYNTVNGMKIYIPYTENIITDGKYDISKASCYPDGFIPDCCVDDCYSMVVEGALFDDTVTA